MDSGQVMTPLMSGFEMQVIIMIMMMMKMKMEIRTNTMLILVMAMVMTIMMPIFWQKYMIAFPWSSSSPFQSVTFRTPL